MKIVVSEVRPNTIKNFTGALKVIGNQALPKAVAETLNQAAGSATKLGKRKVKQEFTTRTPYTVNSVKQLGTAKGHNINRMYSKAGSISPYLGIHDGGGYISAKEEGKKKPIPFAGSSRLSGFKSVIASKYKVNRLGAFKGNPRYFIGIPRGKGRSGNKWNGIWERTNKNTRIRRLRHLSVKQAKIVKTNWWKESSEPFESQNYLSNTFVVKANKILRKYL